MLLFLQRVYDNFAKLVTPKRELYLLDNFNVNTNKNENYAILL